MQYRDNCGIVDFLRHLPSHFPPYPTFARHAAALGFAEHTEEGVWILTPRGLRAIESLGLQPVEDPDADYRITARWEAAPELLSREG